MVSHRMLYNALWRNHITINLQIQTLVLLVLDKREDHDR
jgi:hypothetical protein